jgi:hypothetical protein
VDTAAVAAAAAVPPAFTRASVLRNVRGYCLGVVRRSCLSVRLLGAPLPPPSERSEQCLQRWNVFSTDTRNGSFLSDARMILNVTF